MFYFIFLFRAAGCKNKIKSGWEMVGVGWLCYLFPSKRAAGFRVCMPSNVWGGAVELLPVTGGGNVKYWTGLEKKWRGGAPNLINKVGK